MNSVKDFLEALVRQSNKYYDAIGYEKITVDGSIKSLTPTTGAKYAEIRVESSIATPAARYRIDGVAPSTTDGMALVNLDVFDVTGPENLRRFKVTQTGAGTHVIHITYYK